MNLDDLVDAVGFVRSGPGVPDWTLGCFRRRSITYFTGQEDRTTQVYWLQSRGLTVDLRVNPARRDLVEGGLADTRWADGEMSWSNWTAFLPHARWPEPGRLTRVGNCLIEFAPSGAYVEDWRTQSQGIGPLVGLRMEEERVLATGEVRHRGGGLLVCGRTAALVRGRPDPVGAGNARPASEVSFATQQASDQAFTIQLSTDAGREGTTLSLDGFDLTRPGGRRVIQRLEDGGEALERSFVIDTLERLCLAADTAPHPDGAVWFEREREFLLPGALTDLHR
jgi:hypothetical protein